MTQSAAARSAHLRVQAELVRERHDHAGRARQSMGFDRGAYDTLDWLIAGGGGPLTGEMVGLPIPAAVIAGEEAAAEAVLAGQSSNNWSMIPNELLETAEGPRWATGIMIMFLSR